MASDPPQDDLSVAFPSDDLDLILEDALPPVDDLAVPVVPVDDLVSPREISPEPHPQGEALQLFELEPAEAAPADAPMVLMELEPAEAAPADAPVVLMELEPAGAAQAQAPLVLTEFEPAVASAPVAIASAPVHVAAVPQPAAAAARPTAAPAQSRPAPRPRPSSARAPRPVVSVAPRRGRSKSSKLLAAVGIGGLVVAGAFGVRAMTQDAPPVAQVVLPVAAAAAEVSPAPAPAPAPPAATAKAPTAPEPLSDAEKRRALQGLVFGGRPVSWWEERLDGLYDDSLAAQPEVYGATLKRVQRMGFILKEGPPEHGLWPGQTLIEQINSRRAR